MPPHYSVIESLSDAELVTEVKRLTACERQATSALIASLGELDARRIYLGAGCPSLFMYCTQVLGLSESEAYFRIEAARAARRFPEILDRLADGAITLTVVKLLAPHLTDENVRAVLDEARGLSKRQVEEIVARLHPAADVPGVIRKLPAPRTNAPRGDDRPEVRSRAADDSRAPSAVSARVALLADSPERDSPAHMFASAVTDPAIASMPLRSVPPMAHASDHRPSVQPSSPPTARRAVVTPLAPERYRVQMTIGADTHARLRRAQELLRHTIPDGDPAAVFDRALTLLIRHLERQRFAAKTARPAPRAPGNPRREKCAPPLSSEASHSRCRSGDDVRELVPEPVLKATAQRPNAKPKRYIPANVRREVWQRDGGQCRYVGTLGRCKERSRLEYHHLVPFAEGGPTTPANLVLACAAHNRYEANRWFGDKRT